MGMHPLMPVAIPIHTPMYIHLYPKAICYKLLCMSKPRCTVQCQIKNIKSHHQMIRVWNDSTRMVFTIKDKEEENKQHELRILGCSCLGELGNVLLWECWHAIHLKESWWLNMMTKIQSMIPPGEARNWSQWNMANTGVTRTGIENVGLARPFQVA